MLLARLLLALLLPLAQGGSVLSKKQAKAVAYGDESTTAAAAVSATLDYDAIILGGGPAGLSALSGLARVRRNVLLIDSGVYRNAATRRMHDVLGFDGITPAYFRWLGREKLSYYDTITMINGTVTKVVDATPSNSSTPAYAVHAVLPASATHNISVTLRARSIVLATGLKDDIPATPGLREAWGQGVYWCPWCDGIEHADQPLGILAGLADAAALVREVATLNTNVAAFVNGSDTPAARAAADASFPDWQTYLAARNVTVYNQTLASIDRVVDAAEHEHDADPAAATAPEYDVFNVVLDDGTVVERAAFLTDFPDEQASPVGAELGVTLYGGRLFANQSRGYLTNLPLVYAIGDANSDNVTNVPHALYSGKKTAVYLHVALARQEATAQIAAAKAAGGPAVRARLEQELDPRALWDRMNGPPGDMFNVGEF